MRVRDKELINTPLPSPLPPPPPQITQYQNRWNRPSRATPSAYSPRCVAFQRAKEFTPCDACTCATRNAASPRSMAHPSLSHTSIYTHTHPIPLSLTHTSIHPSTYIHKKAPLPRLDLPKIRRNPYVEIIPLSTGCLGACTYCKTRHARGKLGSYAVEAIVARAQAVVQVRGYVGRCACHGSQPGGAGPSNPTPKPTPQPHNTHNNRRASPSSGSPRRTRAPTAGTSPPQSPQNPA